MNEQPIIGTTESLTLKARNELCKQIPKEWEWNNIFTKRCPVCKRIFIWKRDRKYCSKECSFNKNKIVQ